MYEYIIECTVSKIKIYTIIFSILKSEKTSMIQKSSTFLYRYVGLPEW